jgi:WD40 repeat protein
MTRTLIYKVLQLITVIAFGIFTIILSTIPSEIRAQSNNQVITDLDWSADNQQLAVSYSDGIVEVFNPDNSQPSRVFEMSQRHVPDIEWHQIDNDLLAVADTNGVAFVLQPSTSETVLGFYDDDYGLRQMT